MAVKTVGSIAELQKLLAKDMRARQKRVEAGIRQAAKAGRTVAKQNAPVAFGPLRESIHVEGSQIVADAPHAAAVENGSRPHWVPLEALIEWVTLRARQGKLTPRQIERLPGTTTAGHARRVAAQLQAGLGDNDAGIMQLARDIQRAIAAHGTKPHHFMGRSMPEIMKALDKLVKEALPERENA